MRTLRAIKPSKQFSNATTSTISKLKRLGIQSFYSKTFKVNKVALLIHLGVRVKNPNKTIRKECKNTSSKPWTTSKTTWRKRREKLNRHELLRLNAETVSHKSEDRTHGKKLSSLFWCKKFLSRWQLRDQFIVRKKTTLPFYNADLQTSLKPSEDDIKGNSRINKKLSFNILLINKRFLWRLERTSIQPK